MMGALEDRFNAKIQKDDGCWLWTGATNGVGYGQIRDGRTGKIVYAHRLSWELMHGEIPNGMFVCHECDNPTCVRVDHLFLGTNRDNVADSVLKGRFISNLRLANTARGDRNGARTKPETRARGERHGSKTKPERTLRGELHPMHKLTYDDILTIRLIGKERGSDGRIASMFGVSRSVVNNIRNGKTWNRFS